jgi:peptidoglycan/LPS O-acetylase OafA/YrhL
VELLDWSFRQLPGGLELFGAGHFAAVACRALERRPPPGGSRRSGALIVLGLASLVGLLYVLHWNIDTYWSGSPLLFVWQSLAALAVALLVAGVALDGTLSRLAFANAPALYLGEISYSIYLWHFPTALALAKFLPPSRSEPAFLAIAFFATIAVSALSHRWIERPALARRRYWERRLLDRPGTPPP